MSTGADPTAAAPTAVSITASPNGPLRVEGGVPLYRRRAVHSEHGEPMTWETTEQIETRSTYALCRCGASARKPFCDGAHAKAGFDGNDGAVGFDGNDGAVGFDGNDTAAGTYGERAKELGGSGFTVRDDRSLCMHAGFCGTRVSNVWKQIAQTDESIVRAQVISMIEKCPSGALTFRFDGDDVEPLLPQAIAVTDDGPLWVTGSIPVTTSTGAPLEARNRVTLCRCGASSNKPLCDGAHKTVGFSDR